MRVQGQSSENLLGIKPWLSVGVGLGRSLIGLSIGPLALEVHVKNTSISLNGLWYEANLKVFKVIIHMPLLVHGLHSQILFGLVRALNVVIVPASTYLYSRTWTSYLWCLLVNYQSLQAVSPCLAP